MICYYFVKSHVFETEESLPPLDESDSATGVLGISQFYWKQGTPQDSLVFHLGFVLSVIR